MIDKERVTAETYRQEDERRAQRIFGEYREGSTPRHVDIQRLSKAVAEYVSQVRSLESELKEARGLMEAFVVSHRNNNPFALESFTSFLERTRHD
jgi:hypothetical protein